MLKTVVAILIIYLHRHLVLSVKPKLECGYKQCPPTRDGALNVHLIPHSHMDAGWVKTFDEYYYGSKTSISTANVQLIYHSVLSELLHDKRRKFTFSETAYFWRWWKEQRPATRATFRSLVQEGRIEFAGGGWVQNDEATVDYLQIIDHYTWGLRKLNDTLGPCGKPKAAWQIDTYGHTREQASLMAQMGFDGLFIGRVDHKERAVMIEEDRMEFMWRGSDVLGKMSDIMTHTLYNLYNAPDGFCFDFLCSDEPIVDDPDNRAYNAEKRVNDFISQIERQAKYYEHDNIMVTMGGDFTYQGAANWFMNMDKLINHVNSHPGNITDVNIFYSTPSCYLKAIYLYGRRDKAIYTERRDHLPYGSDINTYWTGFYTSRPSLKYFVRRAHMFLQVVKQLTVIARMGDSFELHLLRHAVNLMLHHDAITGTSQQHVTNDFIKTLMEAIESCTKKVSNILSFLTPTWGGSRRSKNSQQFTVCHQLNMTQCRFTETQDSMLILVYNPLSVKTYFHIKIPAVSQHYNIRDFNNEEVEHQIVPLPAAIINLPGRTSTAIQELCFEAESIPPLGFTAFYVAPIRDPLEENEYVKTQAKTNSNIETDDKSVTSISNEYLKVSINKDTGFLESIAHVDGIKLDISQNFHYYTQTQQTLQSGAYSFRPEKNRPFPVTDNVTYTTVKGPIVKEIRQRFSDWITQIIRLYRGEEFVEFEWIVGPVPIGNDLGKEVVTIYKTNITNHGQFYTDSNGRQMMKRSCWNESVSYDQKLPVSACYYPITSRLCLQSTNNSAAFCVLTDRTQGGTSYNDGEVELMVHRRLLTDDGFGLEESLNEEEFGVGLVVKGRHRMVFGNYRQEIDGLTFSERASHSSRRWLMEPWLFFAPGEKVTRRKWQNIRNKRYSALKVHGLPRHIHILTLEPWKSGSVLLRLENTLEKPLRGRFKDEKPDGTEDVFAKSSHITVHLRQLFFQLKIKAVRETTLAANQWLDDARQMDWSTRYVYNGADDDILPEDNIEDREEPKADRVKENNKEDVPYSDEENYSHRKVLIQRKRGNMERMKPKHTFEDTRRKRSVNDIQENVINSTFVDENTRKRVENYTNNVEIMNRGDKTADTINEEVTRKITKQDKTIEVDVTKTKVVKKTTQRAIEITEQPEFSNATVTTKINENVYKFMKDASKTIEGKKISANILNGKPNIWTKATKLLIDFERSSEVTSSEEDFSGNLKKRSRKRVKDSIKIKRRDPGAPYLAEGINEEDDDDGITKSIYEMYYKTKPKFRSFKPFLRSSEEVETKYRRRKGKSKRFKSNEDYRSMEAVSMEDARKMKTTKKRGRNIKADMPFFLTNKNRGYVENGEEKEFEGRRSAMTSTKSEQSKSRARKREEIDDDAQEEEDREGESEEKNGRNERRKRATEDTQGETSEQEKDEPDYIITLRPTQIRTFVVWFEPYRKPFSM